MLLQRLVEQSHLNLQTARSYDVRPVRWALELDEEGRLRGIVRMTGAGNASDRGRPMSVPTAVIASANRPLLLCGSAEYVLGLPKDDSDPRKAARLQKRAGLRHDLFVELVKRCADVTGETHVRAVNEFLKKLNDGMPDRVPSELAPSDFMTFQVGDVFPTDLPRVQEFWAREREEGGTSTMECLVCGTHAPPERRLQVKIKGIPGGQPSGTAMISGEKKSFLSYGLKESRVSPICKSCAEASHKTLNRLLADRSHSLRVGKSLVWVFWSKRDGEATPILHFLDAPDPNDVRHLLASPQGGSDSTPALRDSQSEFYAVALSACGGRAVVRSYIETSLPKVYRNIRRWFQMQQLVDGSGYDKPQGVWSLSRSLLPTKRSRTQDASKGLDPRMPEILVQSALSGSPLPESLLYLIAARNRAEGDVTRARAVLAKMTLISDPAYPHSGDEFVTLDPANRQPAYLCGRLFAELENAQREALGKDISTSIRDRFYGSASTAPASVFGVLVRGGQAHLGKLRKEKPSAAIAIEQRLEEILASLQDWPPTLDLRGQALFSLGYYHQRASGHAEAKRHITRSIENAETIGDHEGEKRNAR